MTESAMSFDADAMSAKLDELTENLCELDYAARDATVDQDAAKLAQVSQLVSGHIFSLPLMALPTVVMFIIGHLNHARNDSANLLADVGEYATTITGIATRLAAADVDAGMVLELLDIATTLREVFEASPYTPCDHEEH